MAVAESNMAEFKMAAIIKLSQNQWVKFFFQMVGREVWVKIFCVQMVGTNLGKFECVWEEKLRWLNPRWQNSRWENSRWLPSSSWVIMNESESDWISLSQSQNGVKVFLSESERWNQGVWIQHGRIQDGCHYEVESESMSEDFLCQMVGREVWVKFFFVCKWWEPICGKCEWVWEEKLRWLNPRWQNSRWQNSRCLPSSSWVIMNEFESDWTSFSQSQNGVKVFLSESERSITRCLNPKWQ